MSEFKTFFKPRKVLRSQKNFSEETRLLFMYCYECFVCGKNCWDALHHSQGGAFEEADSPLNACPIHNLKCHIGQVFNKEMTSNFLCKTLDYLYSEGYKFNEKDLAYIDKFYDYYKDDENSVIIIKKIKNNYKD